jgi:two-component system phosphate regulon sensor histidine kinase PhoR
MPQRGVLGVGGALVPRSANGFTTLLDGLAEPALLADDGRVSGANAAARALFGENIVGLALKRAIAHPAALQVLEQSAGAVPESAELSGFDRSRRHWLMRVGDLPDGTRLIRFVDRSEARAAEQMRVDFVANASHELRTPLATLVGYTETLRERAAEIDPATSERFLAIVHDEALRMQRIVEDLISLSRIEAERFVQPTEAVALGPLVEQALAGVRHDAAERGSRLASTLEPDLPLIAADRGQILQLLDNLLTNALRYGESGTPVTVTAERDDGMVHLAVADRGEGIPPEHIARITERFYRVDTGRSRSIGGTGLGLSIVKHIVERHRGRLDIDSERGVGTTVHVRLPVAESSS